MLECLQLPVFLESSSNVVCFDGVSCYSVNCVGALSSWLAQRGRIRRLPKKLKITNRVERDEKKSDVASSYKIPLSTLSTILKNKADIRAKSDKRPDARGTRRVRTAVYEDVEAAVLQVVFPPVWNELAEFPGAVDGSTFDKFVSADDDVAITGQRQDEDYIADLVSTMSQRGSNKESDDGPLPASSEVISALVLVRRYCVNVEGCGLSCSDSLDSVEACVLSQAAKSLTQKEIRDYFVPQ
ncbi:hypothetical protein HPB51_009358 [Rhipicephalus microplus]|uniref:HTH psq-type domain-containing protein n=1 Tax=Rhipicephalus microplus TaxID=6941 RepID=A0A9J6F014_RHIMP|nr:hypothetical protein HPB51_009358 [Rhipicephalus microplus]